MMSTIQKQTQNQDDQALDEALDLVSARFADLVAQDYQQRLIEDITRQLFQADSELELAEELVRALAQRCGEHRLLYLGLDELGVAPVVYSKGFAAEPRVPRLPGRSLFTSCQGYLLDQQALSSVLAEDLPTTSGLRLHFQATTLALVTMERAPADSMLLDFLERIGERASQALVSLRQRLTLDQARRAMARQRLQMQKQARLLNLMDDWSRVLSRLEDSYQHLEELLVTTVTTLGGEKGSLMLLDENTQELVVRATCGLDPDVQDRIRRGEHPCKRLKLGEGVAGKVAQSLQPMVVNQVDQEPLFLEPHLSQVTSIVCLPLHVDGLALGVLNVTNKLRGRRFQGQHIEEGMKLARQASQAINNSRLYHLAILDPVTEVYSRSHLFQRTQDELNRARRYQRHLSLLAISLQGMEVVRSHQGHEVGNRAEVHFAEILKECTRETDLVARLGEHSFAVLMPETDALSAMFAAERICQTSRESEMLRRYYVTAHVGICSFPDRAESVSRLVARAEMAMGLAVRSSEGLPVVLAAVAGSELEPPQVVWQAS